MASLFFELSVEMDDGHTHKVIADQRDIAKWEVQPFGGPFTEFDAKAMTGMRFLAWSAMTRQQLTTLKWDAFNDACVEAMPLDDEESELPADALDPGQTVPSA
ncbi:hypothetical protein [Micromonospora arida]